MRKPGRPLTFALLGPFVAGALARRRVATIDLFVDDGEERLTFLAVTRRDRELVRQVRSLLQGGP